MCGSQISCGSLFGCSYVVQLVLNNVSCPRRTATRTSCLVTPWVVSIVESGNKQVTDIDLSSDSRTKNQPKEAVLRWISLGDSWWSFAPTSSQTSQALQALEKHARRSGPVTQGVLENSVGKISGRVFAPQFWVLAGLEECVWIDERTLPKFFY